MAKYLRLGSPINSVTKKVPFHGEMNFTSVKRRSVKTWLSIFLVIIVFLYILMFSTITAPSNSRAGEEELTQVQERIEQIEADIKETHGLLESIKTYVRQIALELPPNEAEAPLRPRPPSSLRGNDTLAVSAASCHAQTPLIGSQVVISHLIDHLPFDNLDGGVWKQGFEIQVEETTWTAEKPLQIFLVPHSHCDPGWLKTFQQYFDTQTKKIFESTLHTLTNDKDAKFIYAEIAFFSTWWEALPQPQREQVLELMKSGRWEMVTGGWVMNDEANTHYAAMIDQLLEGHSWMARNIPGVVPENGWAIDPFGLSPVMAYLLNRADFKNMIIQRTHYEMKKHLAAQRQLEFQWRQSWATSDENDIFAHMMPFYSYDVPHTCGPDPRVCCQFDFIRIPGQSKIKCPWGVPPVAITPQNVGERAATLLEQYRKKASLFKTRALFMPLGDDFRFQTTKEWSVQLDNYRALFNHMNEQSGWHVKAQFATVKDYFTAVAAETPKVPTLSGDFFTYSDRNDNYWSGYYTSRPFYKQVERVTLASLRTAELTFSLAVARSRHFGSSIFSTSAHHNKLIAARRNLALFQHHDGITGTSKNPVVQDYGERLLSAYWNAHSVSAISLAYLSADGDFVPDAKLEVSEDRKTYSDLVNTITIDFSMSPHRRLVVFNALSHQLTTLVTFHSSHHTVAITDAANRRLRSEASLIFKEKGIWHEDKYAISFVVVLDGLASKVFTIDAISQGANAFHSYSNVSLHNMAVTADMTEGSVAVVNEYHGPFTVAKHYASYSQKVNVSSSRFDLEINLETGTMWSVRDKVFGKVINSIVDFVSYGTSTSKEKSGAYLFLPGGEAKKLEYSRPFTRVRQGALSSEACAYIPYIQHCTQVISSGGVDGETLNIENLVDIRDTNNYELVMRVTSDIKHKEFYTDLNGFSFERRKVHSKLTLQGNFYPMPSMAFLEDNAWRMTVASRQPNAAMAAGDGLQIVLDRRLSQDDNRGLAQPVKDNLPTPNSFRILFERVTTKADPGAVPWPSLVAQLVARRLLYPPTLFAVTHDAVATLRDVSPLARPLPCDLHVVNFRTLQLHRDGSDPSAAEVNSELALILHRQAFDCRFTSPACAMLPNGTSVLTDTIFSEVRADFERTSLTLFNSKQRHLDHLTIKPAEIEAYRLTFAPKR